MGPARGGVSVVQEVKIEITEPCRRRRFARNLLVCERGKEGVLSSATVKEPVLRVCMCVELCAAC